jgi:DNA-binding transcriptional ArsR family regulator
VSLSFSDEMIVATTRDLTSADRAQEATLNGEERVVAALEDGPAYTDEIVEATGLALGTVKNKLTALKKAGRVETTGERRSQMEQVQLVSPVSRPYKGSDTGDTSDMSPVAAFFADPPGWLPRQLKVYRENPELHLKPLCTAVAAEILGDGLRWEEVREEVEKALGP